MQSSGNWSTGTIDGRPDYKEFIECVTIRVDEMLFIVNKERLRDASPVFRAMVDGGYSDATQIVITDFSAADVEHLLNWVYNRKISSAVNHLSMLLMADKYLMDEFSTRLVNDLCKKVMLDKTSVSSLDILVADSFLNIPMLKKVAQCAISEKTYSFSKELSDETVMYALQGLHF